MIIKNYNPERQIVKCSEDGGKYLYPLGRTVVKDDCLCAAWCNSGFAFNFIGTGFIISLGSIAQTEIYVKIIVDNTVYKFAVINGAEKLMVENLKEKRHRVRVLRVTEGTVSLRFDLVTVVGNEPRFMSPEIRTKRRIEFLGDSLTCGYGTLAPGTVSVYNTFEEDSTQAYAYLTAEALKAEARTICLSGKGMVCNCNGNREDYRACNFFKTDDFEGADHDFNAWQPDVLVVNIGTNDSWGGAKEDEFISESRKFAEFARSVYPKAQILWVGGIYAPYYGDALKEMIRSLGGKDAGYHIMMLDSFCNNKDEVGGGGHPNVKAHIRFSKAVAKKICSVTGWKCTEEAK